MMEPVSTRPAIQCHSTHANRIPTMGRNAVKSSVNIDAAITQWNIRAMNEWRVIARLRTHDRERETYRQGRVRGQKDRPLLLPQGRHPGLHKGSVRLQGPHERIREGGYTGLRRLARLSPISPRVPREVQPQLPTPHRRGWPRFGGPWGATRGPEEDETSHLPARPGSQDLQGLPRSHPGYPRRGDPRRRRLTVSICKAAPPPRFQLTRSRVRRRCTPSSSSVT